MNFEQLFSLAVKNERKSTHTVILMIRDCLRSQHYLVEGYGSAKKWLVEAHGYSETAANRRLQAARLFEAVPEVGEKLLAGELNLTTMTQIQGTIRREEMRTGEVLSYEVRDSLVAQVENKTEEQAARILATAYPEVLPKVETLRAINDEDSKFSAIFDPELLHLIEKAKELCAVHSVTEVIRVALRDLVKRKDPAVKKATRSAAGAAAKIPAGLRREVLERGCEYENPLTGKRCGSNERAEVDHIVSLALGGTNDPENLRCLCKKHNLFAAEVAFGARHMRQFRRDPFMAYEQ